MTEEKQMVLILLVEELQSDQTQTGHHYEACFTTQISIKKLKDN